MIKLAIPGLQCTLALTQFKAQEIASYVLMFQRAGYQHVFAYDADDPKRERTTIEKWLTDHTGHRYVGWLTEMVTEFTNSEVSFVRLYAVRDPHEAVAFKLNFC